MKKIYSILLLSIMVMTGCKNFRDFTLKGDLKGIKSDTIFVVYQEPEMKLDTIITKKGVFEYKEPIDTFTIFSLIIDHQYEIPIFADKGEEVTITKTDNRFVVNGFGDNKKTDELLDSISSLKNDTLKIQSWAQNFIIDNSNSYMSAYLLKKYFVENSKLNTIVLNTLLGALNDNIKSSHYISVIQKTLDSRTDLSKNKFITNIGMPDEDGKFIPWDILSNKFTLLSFWASWEDESIAQQDSISSLLKEFKDNKFQAVSVSLDYNKQLWKNALPPKDKRWIQACDFRAWDNNLVKQQNISNIPYNILIGPDKQVIARDVKGKELRDILNTKLK